ncbi:phage tail protein [Paratractidigestivibacter sp.]|uniref:phage tail protein n=1 Tax=Paratractidigestivibacter sp. TaxID=2847316 RepID=UPI002AC93B84|nr:tail fiber protein [Paratractidigestivibacter sp.]
MPYLDMNGVDALWAKTKGYVSTHGSSSAGGAPTGAISMYAGTEAPAGWLMCDGSEVSRTEYADLYAVIGTAYGEGDGATTFCVPDLRGRFALGVGGEHAMGGTGGSETVALTEAQMPSHKHGASSNSTGSHTHAPGGTTKRFIASTSTDIDSEVFGDISGSGYKTPRFKDAYKSIGRAETASGGSHSHTITVNNAGGGEAHDNMPPFVTVGYIICC